MIDRKYIREIGKNYLKMELARRGVLGYRLPSGFGYDFLLSNNLKITLRVSTLATSERKHEDKTYSYTKWGFNSIDKSDCDFFVLICLGSDLEIERTYIVPSDKMIDKENIVVYNESDKDLYSTYLNKWESIS